MDLKELKKADAKMASIFENTKYPEKKYAVCESAPE
jgi:hypothetical protein